MAARQETALNLPVYPLREVLSRLSLPPPFNTSAISSKWRCVIAPREDDGATADTVRESQLPLLLTEESMLPFLDAGLPVYGNLERAAAAYAECGGQDSLKWLQDERWRQFPKPQVGLRRGWGMAGTVAEDSSHHHLIKSFDAVLHPTARAEVVVDVSEAELKTTATAASAEDAAETAALVDMPALQDDDVLDLQLFHREDGCPPIPILGEKMEWPSFLDDGAVCDTATWVSRAGMTRPWHINDSGEFILQAALPQIVNEEAEQQRPSLPSPSLPSPVSRAIDAQLYPSRQHGIAASPGMLAIFLPKGGYDWVLHDDEASMKGRVVAVDLFSIPDEALPRDAGLLPVLCVAVLENGGAPLLVPPNLVHLTIALRDCVVVEQRRVSNLWLDDVAYFLHRCSNWIATPLIYPYLQEDLQNDGFVGGQLIPLLLRVFEENYSCAVVSQHRQVLCRRAVMSLFAIAKNSTQFGLSDSSRVSLLRLVTVENEAMRQILQSPSTLSSNTTETLEAWLIAYWDVRRCWPKAGCVFLAPELSSSKGCASRYLPVVYTGCSPVFGAEQPSLEATVQPYFDMRELKDKPLQLNTYLRVHKAAKDDLLDDLF